jgi:adenine-specific DNA-methyltransferase
LAKTERENAEYLSRQLITCIGNKRALLGFIGRGMARVQKRLGKKKLRLFDVFSGSGIVARYFKRHASLLIANDLEKYSALINECYLANAEERDIPRLRSYYDEITRDAKAKPRRGFIAELYAPRDDLHIREGERVFYTARNARYLDTVRQLVGGLPAADQKFFLAPLLSEASIHANTAGVFKGFYKNRETGIGQFGGARRDALLRIEGAIELPFPVFSNFDCEKIVCNGDANKIIGTVDEVDAAYIDPPYNQHPYGSNYFMLNLIAEYRRPENISAVSGIPAGWNRSDYNRRPAALNVFTALAGEIKAKYLLISFNSEGFITLPQMLGLLEKIGRVEVLETSYHTFRGSRNLAGRPLRVKEYLYLVEKK